MTAVGMNDSEAALLAYVTLCCIALSAVLGAPWWAALVGGGLLALQSMANHQRPSAQHAATELFGVPPIAHFASLANAWIAAGAAWLLGTATVLLVVG